MSSRSRRLPLPRFLRHRSLLAAEAVLLVDVLLRIGERGLLASSLPGWAIVIIAMLVVIGAFGSLLLVLERVAGGSVEKVHKVVRGLPLPWTLLLVHGAVFVGCAWVVAWDMGVLKTLW